MPDFAKNQTAKAGLRKKKQTAKTRVQELFYDTNNLQL